MALRIVIVGGVAGGMSAAARARRLNEDASITVLEQGGFISFANCGLPYYLAGRIPSEDKLLITTPQKVRDRFNIDAQVGQEVLRVDRAAKEVEVLDRASGRTYRLGYDKLILAPGASPIVPKVDHVHAPNVFLLRSMEDTRAVRRWLDEQKPASAVIVGAGFIGLEMAEALRERGLAVTLVEKARHVLSPLDPEMAAPVAEELGRHDVRVITGNGLKALHVGEQRLVTAVEVEDGARVAADMVLLSIGVRPNVALAAAAGLMIGPSGAVAVDVFQRTSDPDVYAVGDAAEVTHGVTGPPAWVPLAGPANRQGRLAGEHAATSWAPQAARVLGTAIVQVFGLTVGITGLREAAARAAGFDAQAAYALPPHHAGYYPGAKPISMKLVYDQVTGRILGAQLVGEAGVDKRLDVIATAMHFGGTVDDLAGLDLAYAPQFASAKDAVHVAAMVAQNQRREVMPAVAPAELNGQRLVDVRTRAEYAAGSLPGAINIPLDELRQRLAELDPAAPTVTFCQVGQRGYLAQRILHQHGFDDVKNLKGGVNFAKRFGKALVVPQVRGPVAV
jgi:NADPH-dependent 2,4-dienoyl-CoA reductase/sulfur reductase-like enzyme/rhodanese-related sulfurtransferase